MSNTGPEASQEKSFESINIDQHWPRGLRKSFGFSIFFPYKCMGTVQMQTLPPYKKKVKCQCTIIILSTVDLLCPMICTKIQP